MNPRIAHLVRRGVEHLARRQQDIEPLLGEGSDSDDLLGHGLDWTTSQMWSVTTTSLVGIIVLYLISYTFGQLISTLTVIESPSGHRTNQSIPPQQYSDSSSNEPLLQAEVAVEPGDVEEELVVRRPITSNIRTILAHLSRIGGFRARFRGLGFGLPYGIICTVLTQLSSYGMGTVGTAFATILVSLLLARLHMFWTHSMIASPQSKKWRSLPKIRDCKPLILPALVYAIAQEAGMIPFVVADALGVMGSGDLPNGDVLAQVADLGKAHTVAGLSIFAVVVTFAAVSLIIIIPASITLTRIEAFLLPDGDETIVPFDKDQIVANIDFNAAGSSRALFWRAWQTFSRDGWWRLAKLYAKLIAIELLGALLLAILVAVEMAIFA